MIVNQNNVPIESLDKKALSAIRNNIVGKRLFVEKNKKKWFDDQEVHIVGENYRGTKDIPLDMQVSAAFPVIEMLDRVWLDKKEIAEGYIWDLIYGLMKDPVHKMDFQQCRVRILSARDQGLIEFSDDSGNIEERAWSHLSLKKIWFRITPKYLSLLIYDPIKD